MYAIFMSAPSGDQNLQYLIVPQEQHLADPAVFHRVVRGSGSRGRACAWEKIPNSLIYGPTGEVIAGALAVVGFETVLRKPSAVKVTEADRRQIAERGVPTTLATKGQTANEKSDNPTVHQPLSELFVEMLELVRHQGSDLEREYHRDGRAGRRVAPAIRVTPIPAPVLTPQPVTPTVSPDGALRMSVVPPADIAKKYIHRKVYGVNDFEVFERALRERENVLIYGPTGAGKTMGALAFAAKMGMPTFTISGSVNFDPSHAFGRERLRGSNVMWVDGGATEIARYGGLLILDEVNFIPSKVITPLFPLLDDRRQITLLDNDGETINCHPNVLIVATMNRGYVGTQQTSFALENRFKYRLAWEYDDEVEKKLVPLKSVREFAKQLRVAEAKNTIQTPTPTNAVVDFVQLATDIGLDFAIENFRARYDDTEQAAIKLALDTHRSNIEAELNPAPNTNAQPTVGATLAPWETELLQSTTAPSI